MDADRVWEPNKLRLFISHTSQHKNQVSAQKLGLASLGVDAFVAHADIEPSLEWQMVIELALASCDALVAWLTPDFPTSRWADQEVGFGVARQTLIIPVRLGIDPYGFIGKYQGVQGIGKDPFAISKEIVEALAQNGETGPRFLGAAARAFAAAGSFEMARITFKTLSLLPVDGWTDEQLDLPEEAPLRNNQIEHGVYDRSPLPDLIQRYVAARRPLSSPTPGSPGSPTIECRGEVEKINDVFTVNGRTYADNRSVWLYVKNNGRTAEFSARFWNVRGMPTQWGNYGVRHVSWQGASVTTRPEIDGYGGERRIKVANVAYTPPAFWFYTTESGAEECGNQLPLSEVNPNFVGHTVNFEIEIVNQETGEKLRKIAFISMVPSAREPMFVLQDPVT